VLGNRGGRTLEKEEVEENKGEYGFCHEEGNLIGEGFCTREGKRTASEKIILYQRDEGKKEAATYLGRIWLSSVGRGCIA